jgi:putative ABC transport system permease protein
MRPEHWLYTIPLRLQALLRRRQADQELDDELRDHLEWKTEENIAKGMSPQEARRSALLELGGVERTKEECRDTRRVNWIHDLAQDLHFGLRMLRKSPGFTAVATLTLALGIAANTTIFSDVSAVLLRKPPVKDPDTLCVLTSANRITGNDLVWVSAPDFSSWEEQNDAFGSMAADESGRSFTLTGKGAPPQSVQGDRVTPEYFQILGIAPFLGRTFLPNESQAGNGDVVILSESLWRERYGSDRSVLGKQVEIDQTPYTIIGVMPQRASLRSPWFPPRLWTPLVFGSDDLTSSARGNHYINMVVARLKPGVTVERAQGEMDTVAGRLAAAYPETDAHWGITVLPLEEYLIREAQVRPATMMMLGAVGLVLLIACANIAGLLLARGSARAHEMAVRVALGAGRTRLIRQMLTESLLIGLTGGGAGLILSVGGIRLLRAAFSVNEFGAEQARFLHLDHRTLLFTLAVSICSAILFGLAPAFRVSNVSLGDALAESGRTGSGSFARSRLRNGLVISEIALAVMLLAGAGVMMREVMREFSRPVGFNPHHLIIGNLHLNSRRYEQGAARIALFQRVTEKLRSLPGVESASLDNCIPLGCGYSTSFTVVGQQPVPDSNGYSADYFVVGPDYFRAMQIPLIRGRAFLESDNARAPTVAIVSEEFARRYFPKGDAIGRRIEAATLNAKPAEIVGIAGNVSRDLGMSPDPQLYECDLQFPFTAFPSTALVVRSRIAPAALVPMLRQAVWSVDKDQPVDGIATMEDLFADNAGGDKLMARLLGTFAGLALLLAAVGIYGVIAYSVAQRTREIGIRVALGAQQKDVRGLVLRKGASLSVIGCLIGIVLALPIARVFSSLGLLHDFPDEGVRVALCVAFIVAIVALVASYVPARRAMKVDPMVAVRYE